MRIDICDECNIYTMGCDCDMETDPAIINKVLTDAINEILTELVEEAIKALTEIKEGK